MSGHRVEQLQSVLMRAIQQVLAQGLNDPRYRGLVSVTEVQLAKDLKQATVMISVYPEQHQTLTMHAIQHAARHIRREAGDLVALDRLPELTFKLDMSLKRQAEVSEALARSRETLKPAAPPQEQQDDGGSA